jgi:hypothetical protein
MNRDHEVLGMRVLVGILVSVIGAIALTLSTEIVAAWIPASFAWLVSIEWP